MLSGLSVVECFLRHQVPLPETQKLCQVLWGGVFWGEAYTSRHIVVSGQQTTLRSRFLPSTLSNRVSLVSASVLYRPS